MAQAKRLFKDGRIKFLKGKFDKKIVFVHNEKNHFRETAKDSEE